MTRKSNASRSERPDAEIFTVARHALDQVPGASTGVHAHVEHGYVTLTGTLRWAAESEEAERVVRQIPGVRGVINSIVVVHQPSAMGYEPPL